MAREVDMDGNKYSFDEDEISLDTIYARIKARRIELGHPTTFNPRTPRKTQINTREIFISDTGGVMFK